MNPIAGVAEEKATNVQENLGSPAAAVEPTANRSRDRRSRVQEVEQLLLQQIVSELRLNERPSLATEARVVLVEAKIRHTVAVLVRTIREEVLADAQLNATSTVTSSAGPGNMICGSKTPIRIAVLCEKKAEPPQSFENIDDTCPLIPRLFQLAEKKKLWIFCDVAGAAICFIQLANSTGVWSERYFPVTRDGARFGFSVNSRPFDFKATTPVRISNKDIYPVRVKIVLTNDFHVERQFFSTTHQSASGMVHSDGFPIDAKVNERKKRKTATSPNEEEEPVHPIQSPLQPHSILQQLQTPCLDQPNHNPPQPTAFSRLGSDITPCPAAPAVPLLPLPESVSPPPTPSSTVSFRSTTTGSASAPFSAMSPTSEPAPLSLSSVATTPRKLDSRGRSDECVSVASSGSSSWSRSSAGSRRVEPHDSAAVPSPQGYQHQPPPVPEFSCSSVAHNESLLYDTPDAAAFNIQTATHPNFLASSSSRSPLSLSTPYLIAPSYDQSDINYAPPSAPDYPDQLFPQIPSTAENNVPDSPASPSWLDGYSNSNAHPTHPSLASAVPSTLDQGDSMGSTESLANGDRPFDTADSSFGTSFHAKSAASPSTIFPMPLGVLDGCLSLPPLSLSPDIGLLAIPQLRSVVDDNDVDMTPLVPPMQPLCCSTPLPPTLSDAHPMVPGYFSHPVYRQKFSPVQARPANPASPTAPPPPAIDMLRSAGGVQPGHAAPVSPWPSAPLGDPSPHRYRPDGQAPTAVNIAPFIAKCPPGGFSRFVASYANMHPVVFGLVELPVLNKFAVGPLCKASEYSAYNQPVWRGALAALIDKAPYTGLTLRTAMLTNIVYFHTYDRIHAKISHALGYQGLSTSVIAAVLSCVSLDACVSPIDAADRMYRGAKVTRESSPAVRSLSVVDKAMLEHVTPEAQRMKERGARSLFVQTVSNTLKEKGVAAFFPFAKMRAAEASIVSLFFPIFECFKRATRAVSGTSEHNTSAAFYLPAAFLAFLAPQAAVYPLSFVRRLMDVPPWHSGHDSWWKANRLNFAYFFGNHKRPREIARFVFLENGPRGFYHGFFRRAVPRTTLVATGACIYEWTKKASSPRPSDVEDFLAANVH